MKYRICFTECFDVQFTEEEFQKWKTEEDDNSLTHKDYARHLEEEGMAEGYDRIFEWCDEIDNV